MAENFANEYQTTLNGAIDDSQTSLEVTSAAGAPAANFRFKVDDEYMLVTAVAGTTFTVTRGIEGSTAASHSDGATATHVLTAGGLGQALAEVLSAWQSYTPTWGALTTNPSLGNGSLSAAYRMLDDDAMLLTLRLQMGSTTSYGSGRWYFTLPSGYVTVGEQFLVGGMDDAGSRAHLCHGRIAGSSSQIFIWHAESSNAGWVQSNAPFPWAVNDVIGFGGLLRVAAV